MQEITNTVLPPEVVLALQRAAQAPVGSRHIEIDRVTEWARTKYPELFRPEVDHAAAFGGDQ